MPNTEMTIRVLSFDPGLTLAGWAVCDYKLSDGTINVQRFGDISPNKIASRVNMNDQVEKYGKRLISLDILEDMVQKLVDEYKPDYICSEDAFFNPGTPNAFVALIHWLNTIELLLFKQYDKPLIKLPPRTIKHIVSGSGASGKLPMLQAILADGKIVFKQKKTQEELNEHSTDAISVGVAFIRSILITMMTATSNLVLQPPTKEALATAKNKLAA